MAGQDQAEAPGQIRNPQYRIVVADARNKRDGRAIEKLAYITPRKSRPLSRLTLTASSTGWVSVPNRLRR